MSEIDDEVLKEIAPEIEDMIGTIAKKNGVLVPKNDPVAVLLTAMQYISECYANKTAETVFELKKKLQDEMSVAKDEWYTKVNECAATTVDAVLKQAVEGMTKSLILAQQEAFTKQTSEQMIGIITDRVSKEIEKTEKKISKEIENAEKKKIRWLRFASIASASAAALSLITLALVIAK